MPSFSPRDQKNATGGQLVTVYQDSAGAWYVGAPGDPDCDPMPMGAFMRRQGARLWADRRFPGGVWAPAAPGKTRLRAGVHLPPLSASET